jgi:flagellar biosynthesis/type III secretory pathway protein FliH
VTTRKTNTATKVKSSSSSVTVLDLRARRVSMDQPIIKANEYQTMVDIETFEQKFDRLKHRVRSRLKIECRAVRDKAYQEGVEQGKRDAITNVLQQITSRSETREALASKLSSALLICISDSFANDSGSSLLRARLKSALIAADSTERFEIRVAASSTKDAQKVIDELKTQKGIENFLLRTDDSLGASDALVVSPSLSLDLRLSSLLDAMRSQLIEASKDALIQVSDKPVVDEKASA